MLERRQQRRQKVELSPKLVSGPCGADEVVEARTEYRKPDRVLRPISRRHQLSGETLFDLERRISKVLLGIGDHYTELDQAHQDRMDSLLRQIYERSSQKMVCKGVLYSPSDVHCTEYCRSRRSCLIQFIKLVYESPKAQQIEDIKIYAHQFRLYRQGAWAISDFDGAMHISIYPVYLSLDENDQSDQDSSRHNSVRSDEPILKDYLQKICDLHKYLLDQDVILRRVRLDEAVSAIHKMQGKAISCMEATILAGDWLYTGLGRYLDAVRFDLPIQYDEGVLGENDMENDMEDSET